MDFFNSFEPYFQQVSEVQRIAFNNWQSMMSGMQKTNLLNLPENNEKTVNLQEDLIKSALDFQEQVSRFSIDTQRKFWDNYFQLLRRP